MTKYRVAILANENKDDHLPWTAACENFSNVLGYDIVDLVAENWIEKITQIKYDFFLCRPPGRIAYYKQLYDERIYIISKVLRLPIYPTFDEQMIYENKRLLSYFLKSKNIAHPKTWVFYNREQACDFAENSQYPIVGKTNIGAGGSGVEILKEKEKALQYIETAFSSTGIRRSFSPNFRKGDYLKRLKKRLGNISDSISYFKEKKRAATIEPQKWFVLFQEYIKVNFEWRCVVVDDSYFGHKKLRSFGDKISGTSKVSWDVPDKILLEFINKIVRDNQFWSQAIDLFFDPNRGYLVNELQCFWGSKNPYQMIKKGEPGRFVLKDGQWIFEGGTFNKNNSYDLRLKHVLKLLKNR